MWQLKSKSSISGITTKCNISEIKMTLEQPQTGQEAKVEMDSNADTWCVGKNFVVLEMTRRNANVYTYDSDNYEPFHNVPIVSLATAYDDTDSG